MFQTKVVEKIKIHVLYFVMFFRKSCLFFLDNVEKYCTAGQATGDNIIGRMRIACWLLKATNTFSEYLILIDLLLQQWLNERVSE
jgi:hypothetical protein